MKPPSIVSFRRRLNKANPRKEFFCADLDSVRKIIETDDAKRQYKVSRAVQFLDPDDLQYHQSVGMTNEDQDVDPAGCSRRLVGLEMASPTTMPDPAVTTPGTRPGEWASWPKCSAPPARATALGEETAWGIPAEGEFHVHYQLAVELGAPESVAGRRPSACGDASLACVMRPARGIKLPV